MLNGAEYSDRLRGMHYGAFLAHLHATMQPATYLEIGTEHGATLSLAGCASIAVDPRFVLNRDTMGKKPSCLLFQEPSDDFFRQRSPSALLGGPIDLAFLDGMHLFEFLLRDFINTEKHCREDSVILLHDCMPPHHTMTSRQRGKREDDPPKFPGWWTGDVWKLVPVLKAQRPDLSITTVGCEPTGMVLISNLDPQSRVLDAAYDTLVSTTSTQPTTEDELAHYWASLDVTPASSLITRTDLEARLWPNTVPVALTSRSNPPTIAHD